MMAFVSSAMVPVAAAAVRGLAAALAVGGGIAILRLRHVVAQKAAWTLMLAGAMLMPLLAPWLGPKIAPWLDHQGWVPSVNTLATEAQSVTARVRAWLESVRTRRQEQTAVPASTLVAAQISESPAPAYTQAAPTIPAADHSSASEELAGPLGPQYPPLAVQTYATRQPSPILTAAADATWALYLVVVVALLGRLFYGLGAAIRLWQAGKPVALDSTSMPIRVHAEIASPVTIGSGILLPADYAEWDRDKLSVVLAHESSHVRQCDFYLQLAAGIYAAIFWFSPLGWWLKRKLSNLGEAISDRAAVAHAASRTTYAQILLEFASQPYANRLETRLGVAMARKERITERIEWLLNETSFRQAFAGGRLRIFAAAILAPLAVFAATAFVRVEAKAQSPATPQQPAPAQAPATPDPQSTQAPVTGTSHPDEAPVTVPVAPAAPADVPAAVPVPPIPPVAPVAPDVNVSVGAVHPDVNVKTNTSVSVDTTSYGRGYAYAYGNVQADGDSYAVVTKDGQHMRFNGDYHTSVIDKARAQAQGDFLWFTRDGKEYIVDDPEVLSRIHSIYQPMDALSEQMKALGKQQKEKADREKAEIDRQMAEFRAKRPEFDKQIAELRANEPEFQKKMAELNAEMAKMRVPKVPVIDQKQLDDIKQQMSQLQASQPDFNKKLNELINRMVQLEVPKIDPIDEKKMAELSQEMRELTKTFIDDKVKLTIKDEQYKVNADLYRDLGDKMRVIGDQQRELGQKMRPLAEDADRQIKSIIDESLKNGKARPVQ
jgi:beta-lactamase regulating signal transducer with metallopeptidase domain